MSFLSLNMLCSSSLVEGGAEEGGGREQEGPGEEEENRGGLDSSSFVFIVIQHLVLFIYILRSLNCPAGF